MNYGHSADYTHIDAALRSRWESFLLLEDEMNTFVARPLTDFKAQRDAEVAILQKANPSSPITELEYLIDYQIAYRASPDHQFYTQFDKRLMTEYVTVAMLAHALSEALINAILAIGLAHAGAPELFPLIERSDFKQKWLAAPKSFSTTYSFPKDIALYETLNHLSRQRNALMHYKIELSVEGAKILDGSDFKRNAYNVELQWLRRFFSLPYDLADFARRTITNNPPMLLLDRNPIEIAAAHKST